MMKKHKTVLHRLRTYDTKKNPDLNLPPPQSSIYSYVPASGWLHLKKMKTQF